MQQEHLIAHRQKLSALLFITAVCLAVILSFVMNVTWNIEDVINVSLFTGIPLGLGFALVYRGKVPVFASFLTISSLILAFSMIGVALALLGTRSPAPIADAWLAAADDLLPISAIDIVLATGYLPTSAIWGLKKVYIQTGAYLYVTSVVLLLTDREAIAWRMLLIWGWSFLVISLIAFAAPALGCFSQLSADQVDHLPKAAGRYAMRSFHEFRNSTEPVLALGQASGVITFPSFHVVCALVLAQAWHGVRAIGLVSKILAGVIILSCVPIGGHYLVDLAAGAVVWWCVTVAIDRLGRHRMAISVNPRIALNPA